MDTRIDHRNQAGLYERLSPIYSQLAAAERPFRQRAVRLLAVRPGERVLEIGCGPGETAAELARAAGADGQALALDYAAGMLRQAQKAAFPHPPLLVRGDGRLLPLGASSCHAVYMSFTLELFDLAGQHQLLGEVRRVLWRDGRLALVSLSTHHRTPVLYIYQSLHELLPAIIDCRPIDAAPLLKAAGFTITAQETHLLYGLPLAITLAWRA